MQQCLKSTIKFFYEKDLHFLEKRMLYIKIEFIDISQDYQMQKKKNSPIKQSFYKKV